jgi:hypothetical protein
MAAFDYRQAREQAKRQRTGKRTGVPSPVAFFPAVLAEASRLELRRGHKGLILVWNWNRE